MDAGQAAQDLAQLIDGAMRVDRHAEHLAQHGDADLDADACEKPDQHRARQEVGEEPELEEPRQQQQAGGEQRHHAHQRHVALAGGVAMADRPLAKIAAVAESAATTRWRDEPKIANATSGSSSVYRPGDDRRAGDAGIAEHLRDVHRRERHARQASRSASLRSSGRMPPKSFSDTAASPCVRFATRVLLG